MPEIEIKLVDNFSVQAYKVQQQMELVKAANFDCETPLGENPLYLQLNKWFAQRKRIAQDCLNTKDEALFKQSIDMYQYCNDQIKALLGL